MSPRTSTMSISRVCRESAAIARRPRETAVYARLKEDQRKISG
jgi:hypothetical protein